MTTQIFVLNMTYDVPVKLFSFHLMVMSLVLLAPDARRLFNFLVLKRPTPPSAERPLFRNRIGRRASLIAAQLRVRRMGLSGAPTQRSRLWYSNSGRGAPKTAAVRRLGHRPDDDRRRRAGAAHHRL